jgi:hypothetical protein
MNTAPSLPPLIEHLIAYQHAVQEHIRVALEHIFGNAPRRAAR